MMMSILHYLYVIIALVLKIVFWPITLILWICKPSSSKVHEADPEEARRFFGGE